MDFPRHIHNGFSWNGCRVLHHALADSFVVHKQDCLHAHALPDSLNIYIYGGQLPASGLSIPRNPPDRP